MSISCSSCTNLTAAGCNLGMQLRADAPLSFAALLDACDELSLGGGGP